MASPGMSPADEEPSSTDIDDRHYSLQVEQENTQKRTFTSWVNSQLEKHLPPTVISDLYADVGKGHVLLDLLEVLSGQQLPREKGSNTFQRRSNIENALTFLKNRSIKLINIHVADIIEGKPSIILGLIWTIILHFHIEELARTLACGYGSPSVDRLNSEGSSPTASPPAKRIATGKDRWKMSAKKALLFWAKEQCSKHGSISVADFKSSWRNGLAFLAVIHALRPDLVDMERVKGRSNKENLKEAFHIAEKELNIPRLLEPEDVDVINPDEKSIMTYVAQFLQHFKSSPVVEEEVQGKVAETLSWLDAQKQKLTKLLTETENMPFNEKFQEMLSFMKVFGEEKKAFLPLLTSKGQAPELSEDYLKMREAWDGLTAQMNEWKAKLDCLLPPPLDAVEDWLQEVEHQLAEDLSDSQELGKAVAVLEGKRKSIQRLMSCFEQHWKTLQSFDNRDEAGVLLVPPEKLEEMRKRFSSIQLTDFNTFMEYYHSFCSAILQELMNKLNIWDIKYGTKEMVESQLADWQEFIEAKGFLRQLETALCVCEEKKNKILNTSNLGATPEDACKLFKLVESQISRCEKYIDNVNENLRKILAAWGTYNENIQLLKAWLEETRKEHPKKVTAEILAAWNSRHGSLNEAGNFLIESSTEEVGSAISGELKKLNRKWARHIKKTHFEMRLLRTQEEEMKIRSDGNGDADPLMKEPDELGHPVSDSMETPGAHFESPEALSLVHGGDSHTPEPFLSEKDVKRNFEDAYKELEASVLMAMRLLDQKAGPEETISKHEEAFCILDTNILHKFLKAAEQLKDISPACEKAVVEEKSKDVRERWEAVRREIVSFVQLKMEVEREKLNKVFSKLNKQVNKEQKLLRAGKTKRLLEEHEAEFSQQGSLGELNTCLEAMKTMDEKMTEEEKQLGKKTPIGEYEQKKEELRRRASAVYTALVSKAGDNHLPKRGDFLLASDGENTCLSNPSDQVSPEAGQGGTAHKKVELGKNLQNGGQHAEKFGRDADSPSERLKESYDTASHNLKLHLSNIRENVTSALTDVKDISCFQNKLQELEALQNKGDSAWKWFASLQLEKISDHAENLDVPENPQEEMLGEWNELHFVLNKRVESLKAVLALLSPIQNEWIQLCNADKQLRNRDVPHAVVSNSSLPFKKVKKMQASIADCTRRCGRIEQECFSRGEIEPKDSQIVNTVTGEYRRQLRELDSKIQALEAVLHDLETFLSFLNRIKQPASMSTPLGNTPKLFGEGELQEISLMKKEAKRLDEKLKQIDIRLDVAETGQKISCEELLASLLPKETPTASSSSEEQEIYKNSEVQKEFLLKNRELFKSIHDIHDKVSKIGLRDPTIPAVQQRSKLLSELRQKLERLAGETRTLNDTARQLSTSTKDGAEDLKKQWGLTEGFWKKTKLAITERQEHCARVIELLKQYHSCKSSLASMIQKQEQALSQQASYMGKENLQRTIAKINAIKQEFYSHSEDVDRISQICKNLHSQLSKMKSFEEPPFENEANALVDRWLDINERTENYCDNLGRALALWDKLLNLSSVVDEWSSTELKSLEHAPLTGKELAELEAGLQFQESNLEEFDAKVEEIQTLLNGGEPPLELQVIKSSLLSKMEVIRSHLRSKSIPTVLNGNTAELKGDLDLAKTQIGMTESLLKALSPSDTLEIFTKLEEINQKILQQKHHVKLLQKETGCLSPEVAELKKQLKSITDLFNAKKKIFQDHFITLLNYQCEDFNEWFSSTQLSLKECFDPSETKEELEEKTQRLMSFLSFEGKGKEIHEVKTLLNQLKSYLPKANVSQLSNWVRDQEVELERITRECQIREQELRISLQQFARLEDEFGSLEEWLNLQEEKWQEVQMEKPERERFYQILLKQRESFDSFSWLANSLRKSGFSSDEVVVESSQLVSKYKMLLSHIRKSLGFSQVLSAEEKSFEDLAQSMFCWVQRLKESVLGLTSKESKMPVDERLHQIKEIVLMKDEGNAKLENIASLGDHLKSVSASKNVAIQQMVSDLRNQWEFTIQLATEFLRHQEQLQLQKEQNKQQEDDIQVALCERGKQKHELNLSLQRGSQETQSQLANCTMLLHEVEDLTLLLEEVAKQRGALEGCGAKSVSGEYLVALRHLHGNLLSRLQATVKRLEGHVEEEQRCKELIKQLKVILKELLEPTNTHQKQVHQNTLIQIEDTLQEIIDVLDATRQTFSPLDIMHSKDVMDAPEIKQKKHFKTMLGHMELMGIQSNTLKQNGRSPGESQSQQKADEIANGGKLAGSALPFAAGENSVTELLDGSQEEQPEEPSGMEDQMNREAQQLFQECATNKKQPPSSVATESQAGWPSLTQDSEAGLASIEDVLHEDQADSVYADLAEKVKMVKIPAAELDIVLVTDQLKEIENLCAQLEKQKAQALLLSQGDFLTEAERRESRLPEPPSIDSSAWDGLLQELMAIKAAKENQFRLINNYQECLAAVQTSMQHLSAAENIKIRGPIEDTLLLENIKRCLASIHKERVLLQKLKSKHESLSRHLTSMDKELTQSQVSQVEQWWKQMEESLQRKQFQIAVEADEFKLFRDKVQDLQRSLQEQRHLQTGMGSCGGGDHIHPALLSTELQTLKHRVSLLRGDAEERMKRIWSDSGKKALESAIDDLQNQVEELEQLTPREDTKISSHCPQVCELIKKVEEAILWAKISMLCVDENLALFPEDLLSQIKNCKALIRGAEEREATIEQLAHEIRNLTPWLESNEASSLGLLSQKLQTFYQDLLQRLVQRSEQLESQLGKRQKLFSDTEKFEAQLGNIERRSIPDGGKTNQKSELDHQQAILEETAKEVQEIEGLVDANYQDLPQGLNVFERLFLNDYLRSLRSRAKRADRLIQIKHSVVQNQRDACTKLLERITALQQELSNLHCDELKLDLKEMLHPEQATERKLSGIKEKALMVQSSLSYLGKYKEIWDCLGLEWDAPCIKELQSQFCKTKGNFEQKVKCLANSQKALGEIEAIICNLQKHCNALQDCSESTSQIGLLSGKILSWRVAHARSLSQEALGLLSKMEADDTSSVKEAKMEQIKKLGEKIDGLAQTIQAMQEKSRRKQGLHSPLDRSLGILKGVKSQLQLPLLLDLEIQTIMYEMAYCEVLEEAVEGEARFAEKLIEKKSEALEGKSPFQDRLETELDELQRLEFQLKADIAVRRSTLEEAFQAVKSYNEAVEKAAELYSQCEALVHPSSLSLEELEESSLLWHQKKAEFESAKAAVEELASTVESKIDAKARKRLGKTLQNLATKSLKVKEQDRKRTSDIQRSSERYQKFKRSKEIIHDNLNDMERMLQKSLLHVPKSYKDALELSEQSKTMASQLISVEEDLMKLRQGAGELNSVCSESDCALITMTVSALWLKWLYLLRTAKEWESKCEEQVQEWKSINEDLEREAIILDNLQEELPESPKEKGRATKQELQEFLECAKYYEESVDTEKLLLRLILQRLKNILSVPLCHEGEGSSPVVNEIHIMQDRIKELCQKVQKQKDAAEAEIGDRNKVTEDIGVVKRALGEIGSLLQEGEALNEKTANLEEIRRALDKQRQNFEQMMDGLRIKYSEMYTIVPVEIETHLEDCKQTLQDLEEKVSTELEKKSPHYVTNKKIEAINKGLQAIENLLQQKSNNVTEAKDIQKRAWDLLDLWHYKMNELDSLVQEIVEDDPSQGPELMDLLMIPLQRYQQVSQSAERRTANLNKAAGKMEECDELLQSTRVWLENTNRLITEEANTESAKALNKRMSALQMAAEDSEQKQNMLTAICTELEEFSALLETGHLAQELNEVNDQVKTLQQKIMEILPHIQHLADEVEAIESEVKMMEKDVDKIKTILAPSEDTLSFSPKDHLKHGQVILAHISPMQKTVAEIQAYKDKLSLPDLTLKPLTVFQRTKELSRELKTLERITKEQNALLEPIVKELEKNEQEIDYLKQYQFLRSESDELATEALLPSQGDEAEKIKQQIALLCERKEDILTAMKNSLLELHQRQDQTEEEDDILESPVSEENGDGVDWQPKKRGSLSLLPSLVEEVEDSSFHDDGKASSAQITNTAEPLQRRSRGDAKETVGTPRPGSEPAQVLRACQAQIAELKLCLKRAKETLGSETQTRQMQQTVEQHLAACQVSLAEIEQKVMQLLEDCKDKSTSDSPGLQQEAENLSSKLKDVKCNLERVQDMLQDKHVEKELSPDENISDLSKEFPCTTSEKHPLNKSNGLEKQQELLLKLSEQTNLIDFLNVYMEEIQPEVGEGTVLELQSSFEIPTSVNDPQDLTLKDQAGDKWQYLQEELLFKTNLSHCQFAEPQISTKINILPKGATSSVRTPTVEELKTYTAQLGSLSQEASVQIQENSAGEVSSNLDQKVFELLLAISRCLNNMEQMLNNYVLTSEEVPMQQALCETVSEELQKLHADIDDKKDDLLKSITCAGGNPDRFSQCFSNLQTWLQLTQAAVASKGKSMKEELNHHSNFQNEIRRLYDTLVEKKSKLQQDFSAVSGCSVSKQLQIIDTFEVELQNLEMQAAKLRDHGERHSFPVSVIHEVYKLEDVLDELWEILRAKQRELTSPFIDGQQYEALLRGLAELVALGQEKTAQVPELRTTSRANLQFHLQNHKSFFCNLNTHMLLVQTCSKKVAPSVLQKTEKFCNELVQDVRSLEKQAVQHGAHLERLLQDWIEFDDSYTSFCPKLEALSSTLPSVNLVEETEESLMERTQLFQQIKLKVEEEQAWYFQIVKEGRKLMASVNCPELQSQVEKLEEQWMSLSGKVDHELQRLETLFRLLSSYNRDSKELDNWLESAQHRVNAWETQSLHAAEDLNTVRNHLNNLLEFSKEVDDKSSLKSSVISTGNQLLLLKETSATLLRSFLAEYEQKWANLISQLPGIQEKFHQLQMAMMPSQEAIEELTRWMSRVNEERRDDAVVNLQSPVCQVKSLLKKYKEYLMEMNFKQWVVDYVNQSLLQTMILNVESKRYERTEFAERLGELNLQWHTLQGALNGKVKELEHILESVAENERKAQSLGSWFEAQRKRLQKAEKPAGLAAAQETARNCKDLVGPFCKTRNTH